MKRLYTTIAAFMLFVASFAQTTAPTPATSTPKGTTQEEYNYLTKGLKTQLESGLDSKKGYDVKKIFTQAVKTSGDTWNAGVEKTVDLLELKRDGETKPCALLYIVRKKDGATVADPDQYICVPSVFSTVEILQQANAKYFSLSKNDLQAMLFTLARSSAMYAAY